MAISLQDGLYIEAPFAADRKSYVGTGQLFTAKENIPKSYRYKNMRVLNLDTNSTHRLESDLETWTPIVTELPSWVKTSQSQVYLASFGGQLPASRIDGLEQPSDFDEPAFTATGLPTGYQPTVTGTYPNLVIGIPAGEKGEKGNKGDPGEKGETGSGIMIQGTDSVVNIKAKSATTLGLLWVASDTGTDSYATAVAAGDGLVSDGTGWFTIGPIRGPEGEPGTTLHSGLTDAANPDLHPISSITGLATALATISIDTGKFIIFKGKNNNTPANKYILEAGDYICGIWVEGGTELYAIDFAKYNGGTNTVITNYTLINYAIL